jgi:hypothetical protein
MTQAERSHPLHQSEEIMPRIITTTRLVLRPVHSSEAAALHALFGHEAVRRSLTDGAVMSREWIAGLIRDSDASFTGRGLGL